MKQIGNIANRWTVIVIVVLHVVIAGAYTFPRNLVPGPLAAWAQMLVPPLFHQQWKLFAPDPPLCSCVLEGRFVQGQWSSIDHGPDTYLQRRTMQSLARHVQAEVQQGDTIPDPHLVQAMRMNILAGYSGSGRGQIAPDPEFRLVERCIIDPRQPKDRMVRITRLSTP